MQKSVVALYRKPYRIVFPQYSAYFDSLGDARMGAKGYINRHMGNKPVVIERINRDKNRNPKYSLSEIYEKYESWKLDTRTMWPVKV